MYKPGDIVLVKMHPSSSTELKRYRPCVITFDQVDSRFYTITPLTSQAKIHSLKTEFVIQPSSNNNLEKPSLLMCWYLETIGIKRIQKSIGLLDKSDYQSMKTSLKHIFK
jgi:mRNA-degrading endonuclease toxin of MazEF toxin-antitoxin module